MKLGTVKIKEFEWQKEIYGYVSIPGAFSFNENKPKRLSALKSQIGRTGKFSAQQAVQLHGGMGVSEEMMIGHYLKKMVYIDALFGNSDYHSKKFAS